MEYTRAPLAWFPLQIVVGTFSQAQKVCSQSKMQSALQRTQ
jgi:hypothetical protein